jgi:hypothetical protein
VTAPEASAAVSTLVSRGRVVADQRRVWLLHSGHIAMAQLLTMAARLRQYCSSQAGIWLTPAPTELSGVHRRDDGFDEADADNGSQCNFVFSRIIKK